MAYPRSKVIVSGVYLCHMFVSVFDWVCASQSFLKTLVTSGDVLLLVSRGTKTDIELELPMKDVVQVSVLFSALMTALSFPCMFWLFCLLHACNRSFIKGSYNAIISKLEVCIILKFS